MLRWLTFLAWFLLASIISIEVGTLAFLAFGNNQNLPTPGLGIATLALLDGILFYSWTTIKLGGLLPEKILTPTTKITNFIFFLLLLLASIAVLFIAIGLLMLMISLLLAVPFGTLVYLGVYRDFPVGAAQGTLATIMTLKLGFAALIVIGEKRLFEDYRKFLILLLCSFLGNIVVSFLHGLAPGFLVSITDAIAAIIVSIIAIIWLLFMFVGSIWGIITLIMDMIGLLSRAGDKLRT